MKQSARKLQKAYPFYENLKTLFHEKNWLKSRTRLVHHIFTIAPLFGMIIINPIWINYENNKRELQGL